MSRVKKSKIRNKKFIKLSLVLFFVVLGINSIILMGITENTNKPVSNVKESQIDNNIVIENQINKVNISSIGDIMVHSPQLDAQYDESTSSYSFDNNFKYVKSHLENSDLSIGNLETTLAGSGTPYSSYPQFNSPDSLADAIKFAGIDILSTINNHSFDKGDLGFERTLEVLKSKNIDYIGTRKNLEDKNYIEKEINNISLGITSFSYGDIINDNKFLNGIKLSEKSKDKANIFSSNNVDLAFETINETLNDMKQTDMQIVVIHWGDEYKRIPNKFQEDLAKLLCNEGVDIIIGSHPHMVQPVEMIYSDDDTQETLVIYSLGNFLSNQRRELLNTPYTEDGLMVDIEISKNINEDKTYISSVNCIPTWVNKYTNNGKLFYEIIPLSDRNLLVNMPNLPLDKAESSYNNTFEQVKQSDIIKVIDNPFK